MEQSKDEDEGVKDLGESEELISFDPCARTASLPDNHTAASSSLAA